ncbi:sugar phosphate isomerase/epimerase [Rhodococcus jostii]|uniref:Sugar phosphate isomerase/epimerase n=1 Tax=Rhodococcus jostii TaxID=132919 RepID=A0ABU4C6Y7_RHOJO|nr:sugar phosphate isomerase/epimerase [Rhodococcus jostii]MDV6279167.1 sugar phosphate isomerase/epimerase [Rhodococcus jostii]
MTLGAICFRDRPFPQIITAASTSGFAGIGLTVGQCVSALERGLALEELPKRIEDAGLEVAELELVRLCDEGPTRWANSLVEDLVGTIQPDRLHTAAFTGETAKAADEFAALCQRHPGTPVAVEFMPYSVVENAESALSMVSHAGTDNAAIVLDIVHFFRSGSTIEQLDNRLLEHVAVVQLSDVSARPGVGLADEARHLRTYPGRGNLDTVGFLTKIIRVETDLPPISVEPVSDALERLPLEVVSEEVMFTTLQILEKAELSASNTTP